MNPFETYLLQNEYRKLAELGDRLAKADQQIDWEAFRPILQGLFDNQDPREADPTWTPS